MWIFEVIFDFIINYYSNNSFNEKNIVIPDEVEVATSPPKNDQPKSSFFDLFWSSWKKIFNINSWSFLNKSYNAKNIVIDDDDPGLESNTKIEEITDNDNLPKKTKQ
jgi:hypothetical protein